MLPCNVGRWHAMGEGRLMKYLFKQVPFWLALANFCSGSFQFGTALFRDSLLHIALGSLAVFVGYMCWRHIKWKKTYFIIV
jgi:hypothetical protein